MNENDLQTLQKFLVGRTIVEVFRDDSRASATQQAPGGALIIFDDGTQLNIPVRNIAIVGGSMKAVIT